VCEQVLRDAYDRRYIEIKARKSYVLFTQDRTVWFDKPEHSVFSAQSEKLEHPV
jgi:hypothetical protein